jgi:hypothetical protein
MVFNKQTKISIISLFIALTFVFGSSFITTKHEIIAMIYIITGYAVLQFILNRCIE